MDPNEFETLHVLMLRQGRYKVGQHKVGPRFVSTLTLWDSDVHVARWAAYDVAALRERFGQRWQDDLNRILGNKLFRVVGERANGERVDLVGEPSAATPRRRARKLESEAELIARVKAARTRAHGRKPSFAEIAYHLAEHEESLPFERVGAVLVRISPDANPLRLASYRSYWGKKVEETATPCRLCEIE